MHILIIDRSGSKIATLAVAGVIEIKSYRCSQNKILKQSNKHLHRAELGIRVLEKVYLPEQIFVGFSGNRKPIRIAVCPASWKLSRTFRFDGSALIINPCTPINKEAQFVQKSNNEWRITLRWSHEALAEAAYNMTFWYMGKIGELIYGNGVPKELSEMTSAEAGRNAIKMMLYYAIKRCRTKWENQRAVSLYNTYCFGYSLGMNFRNKSGSREMLWPEDLREITRHGTTRHGCTIV